MTSSTSRIVPGADTQVLNTAIVGGGRACEAILQMVRDGVLSKMRLRIVGIADVDQRRPGIRMARELNVPLVTTDYEKLYDIPGLDLIIELTGRQDLRDELERNRPRNVTLIDHVGARLFWEVHQAEQAVISQRTAAREQVEAERRRMTQIFDSIPDEVLVLDPDQVIQDANAAFLRNNSLRIDDVRGSHCYEVDQGVRGECQVAVEDCPVFQAMQEKRSASVVRKHFDQDGNARYAAIVAGPILDEAQNVLGVVEMTSDITSRIRLEEELKAKEVQLNQFMDHAPLSAYVKTRAGQYLQVNPATCKLYGKRRREIIGKTDREIFPKQTAKQLRAGDKEVLESGRVESFDHEVELSCGRVSLSTVKFPLFDAARKKVTAICGLSKDVTLQKEVEAALAQTREHLQNILDNSPVMIITTDLDSKVVSFNRGAEISLGYQADEIIGEPAGILYREVAEREALIRRVTEEGSVREYDTQLVCKDGKQLPVSITISQLRDSSGRMIGTVGISRDISRRKGLMNQIIQSERLAAVGRLAAGVAHEINNPLAIISEIGGFLTDLVEGPTVTDHDKLVQSLKKWLPRLNEQVKRGRSVTYRMLRFARKIEADVDVVDVNKALDEVLPFLMKEAKLATVTISRDYQEDLPNVHVEEMQLQEIFINLITNAIQAMKDRGHGNVWLSTRGEAGKVLITVKDDGPGIPEKIKDRLFDPFVSTKPPGHGTGLGLSICYGVVKRYDGEIRVESEEGKGATFTVVMPAWEAKQGQSSPQPVNS